MTKTICDICGEEILKSKFTDPIKSEEFCISRYGRRWDICDKCRVSLNRWINIRKTGFDETCEAESEE